MDSLYETAGFEMNGAIFFSSKYGSTAQYANWIGEATGLPVFDVKDANANPSQYDFLVLGSPIIYYKVLNRKWVKKNLASIENKPIIFFTVSGAPSGSKLNGWIADSLPANFISKIKHVALRGRQKPEELTWWESLMLKIAAMMNEDPETRKQELEGFDYMDKSSIEGIIKLVQQFRSCETASSKQVAPSQVKLE
jgi:menaquinone-dependent protoporphyrinogen IX oxidase